MILWPCGPLCLQVPPGPDTLLGPGQAGHRQKLDPQGPDTEYIHAYTYIIYIYRYRERYVYIHIETYVYTMQRYIYLSICIHIYTWFLVPKSLPVIGFQNRNRRMLGVLTVWVELYEALFACLGWRALRRAGSAMLAL